VLGEPVELVRAEGPRAVAASGTSLAVGDRVVTGPTGRALITFLDGTTVTVEPRAEITVREMDVGGREQSRIRVLITAGAVWARVANLLAGRGTVSLASNAHAAVARDGLIGAEQRRDGSFVCWTRAGTVQLVDAAGTTQGLLQPGHRATVAPGGVPVTEPFSVHRSVLEVTARGPVWPLLVMPDGVRLAGFVAPGVEVNQVFGSLTARRPDATWTVEVPGGLPGPYLVHLTGIADGPFTVTVVGRFRGRDVFERRWTGAIRTGERLVGGVVQEFNVLQTASASEAEVLAGSLSRLRPPREPLAGTVLLSPLEAAAAPAR
jgi:hypothetical protein